MANSMQYGKQESTQSQISLSPKSSGDWIRKGAICGIIGGITFAVFEMIVSMLSGMSFWAPLRMIAGIALGDRALTPATSLGAAIVTGMVIHFAFSALFGGIYGFFVKRTPLLQPKIPMILGATFYGLLLWIVNFQLIARLAGWNWFPEANQFWAFIAHTFFFGTVLGRYLNQMKGTGEAKMELRKAA